jgi:L,D-peptidoglycan transpeptidase YkuD (ErfK/YbiS/YcfS/YnhG family)
LRTSVGVTLSALVLSIAVWLEQRSSVPSELPRCPTAERVVRIDTRTHALVACEDGVAVHAYRVRLGRGGVGKTREGDLRTPLGSYALAPPRPSDRFGTFVLVGYPTLEQERAGYTGSAIGIHGPPRHLRALGPYLNVIDSTAGCIGIATDDEMNELSAWLESRDVRRVEIEGPDAS